MQLDERGIPVLAPGVIAAPECPPNPCKLCTGTDAQGGESWAWCQRFNTCAATIDWEKVYNRD